MKNFTSNSMDGKKGLRKTVLVLGLAIAAGCGVVNAQSAKQASGEESEQTHFLQRNPGTGGPVRNVTTTPFCPSLGTIQMVDIGSDKVLISWSNATNFDAIQLRATNQFTGTTQLYSISGNPNPGRYFITGLLPHTTYTIDESTICNGIQSAWGHPITVTTFAPRVASGQIHINPTQIYITPNPATTTASVAFKTDIHTNQEVTISNTTGTIVYTNSVIANSEKVVMNIDVSNWVPGMYFVRLTNNRGVSSDRMIVQ